MVATAQAQSGKGASEDCSTELSVHYAPPPPSQPPPSPPPPKLGVCLWPCRGDRPFPPSLRLHALNGTTGCGAVSSTQCRCTCSGTDGARGTRMKKSVWSTSPAIPPNKAVLLGQKKQNRDDTCIPFSKLRVRTHAHRPELRRRIRGGCSCRCVPKSLTNSSFGSISRSRVRCLRRH